jgi:hypothetical protein
VAWIVRVVKIGAEGEGPATDVMEINRLGDLADIANLGLTLAKTKRLLAGLQQEIVAAHVRDHAVRRPACSRCGDSCRVKDYQNHVVATLFGQVAVRLPRFRCGACGGSETGIDWPSHETVQNLGVITPLNERMLVPTFGCGMLTVEGSRGPSNRRSMDRPAGTGPGGRDELAGHD